MEIVSSVDENEWNKFLDICDTATIYHTPEWKKLMEETFNYDPYYIFAKDNEKIVGLLPMFHVKSKLAGDSLCCVPFAHECGPIGDVNVLNKMIEDGIDFYRNKEIGSDKHHFNRHIEIKDSLLSEFHKQSIFSIYILELSSVSNTWNTIHKSIRRYIKKSLAEVEISKSNSIEDAELFYHANCRNKQDKGILAHPKDLFINIARLMPEYIDIYLAKFDGKIIGGIFNINYKNKVFYGFGATDPRYTDQHPLYACLWKSIEDACKNNYRTFDFGLAANNEPGMINFKKRWGAIEKKLYYSYYPMIEEGSGEASSRYQIMAKIIKKLPIQVYKKFSDIYYINHWAKIL